MFRLGEKKPKKEIKYRKISPTVNLLVWFFASVGINLILEILQRRSLADAIYFMIMSAPKFLMSTALVLLTTSGMLVVKRKMFALAVPAALWLIIGITNTVVLAFRPLPLSVSDFRLVGEAIQMSSLYLKPYHIFLIIAGLTALIAGLVFLFKYGAQYRLAMVKTNFAIFSLLLVLLVSYLLVISFNDFYPRMDDEMPDEYYERVGFVFNFYKSAGSTGVYQPPGYSDDKVNELQNELNNAPELPISPEMIDGKPNIIVLQLESFFDMTWMNGISISQDPVPNYRKLKENNPSGYLGVPSYGGGTSNVEFEVLSGMNLDHFSIGESPYYTLLKENVLADSAPFNMKALGYTTHAIHNHNALFYQRNIAYSHLGFDTFTPIEYMNGLEHNSLSWAKDKVLLGEIFSALESTEERDFVFTVSVQAHGPYYGFNPKEFSEPITVSGDNLTPEQKAGHSYYASTIKEMDNMLGELVKMIDEYDENCVLVVYGDHLPAIDFSKNYLSAPNVYTSEYVIYANYGIEAENRDLETYQLLAYVQELLGMNSGTLVKFHQKFSDSPSYQNDLKILEYSLTSEEAMAGSVGTDIKYSTHPPRITEVKSEGGSLFVYGENFTKWSKVTVGGNIIMETEFVSPECIVIRGMSTYDIASVYVSQMARDNSTVLETVMR